MTVLDLDGLRRRGGRVVTTDTTNEPAVTTARRPERPGPARRLVVPPGRCRWPGCGCCSRCPRRTSCWSTTRAHFWLVFLVAAVNVALAAQVDRAARRHDDAAARCWSGSGSWPPRCSSGCTRWPPPGCCSTAATAGSRWPPRSGLALAAVFTAASAAGLRRRPARPPCCASAPWLRAALVRGRRGLGRRVPGRAAAAGRSGDRRPLERPARRAGGRGRAALPRRRPCASSCCTGAGARWCCCRSSPRTCCSPRRWSRSRSAVNWQLTWWLWHVLMVRGVRLRRLQRLRHLPAGGLDQRTVRRGRHRTRRCGWCAREYGSALESLVAALQRQEAGEISADEMALITRGPGRAGSG